MKIGFDIDGVLASFIPAYQRLFVETTGRNTFHPNDDKDPPCWNWPQYRGYTKEEVDLVWARIKASRDFWLSLGETQHCSTLRMCIADLNRWHDIYFVTNRVGVDVKWQTEQWLMLHLGIEGPTVLISSMKGLCARALKLDCYIDDNLDNANDVITQTLPSTRAQRGTAPVNEQPDTRVYLLNRNYNYEGLCDNRIVRVNTLGQMLDRELVNL